MHPSGPIELQKHRFVSMAGITCKAFNIHAFKHLPIWRASISSYETKKKQTSVSYQVVRDVLIIQFNFVRIMLEKVGPIVFRKYPLFQIICIPKTHCCNLKKYP